jgi:hypothetical protein
MKATKVENDSHLDRIVPSANAGADTQRSLLGVDPRILAQLSSLAVQTTATNEVGVVFEHIGASHDINGAGLGESLAGVQRLDTGNFVVTFTEKKSGPLEDTRPHNVRSLGPGRECALARSNGGIDIGVGGHLDIG